MDISKARRLVELEKDGRKILLTLWEGNQISSCLEDKEEKYCETCQCDDEICQEYIDHLKAKGYGATEIKLGEVAAESLPTFIQEREVAAEIEPVSETEEIEHAESQTVEAVPGSPEE